MLTMMTILLLMIDDEVCDEHDVVGDAYDEHDVEDEVDDATDVGDDVENDVDVDFKLQAQKTPFDRTLPQARRTLLFDGSMGESRSLTATAFVPNLG